LIRYSRVVGSYNDIIDRGSLPTKGLLYQAFLVVQLKSSLRTINDRHHGLANIYGICMLSIADHYNGELVSTERYILHMKVLLELCYICMGSSQWGK
jgi:hypothetical protein